MHGRPAGAAVAAALALLLAGCGGGSQAPARQAGATTAATTAGRPHAARRERPRRRRVAPEPVPAHVRPRSVHVPVLTWHRVTRLAALPATAKPASPDLVVEPRTFAAEIAALDDHGFHAISQTRLYRALFHGARLPSKPVLLTFDDGYVDDAEHVLPVLRRHHMTGTFFIITGRFHEPGFLTAAQVRRLDRLGMDVGDHTRDHLDLPGMPAAELRAETAGSRRRLERVLGHPVYAFAYPAGHHDAASEAAVAAAGFTLAFTTEYGTTLSSTDRLTLPRLHIGRAATPQSVLALAAA